MAITFKPKEILFESETMNFIQLGENAGESLLSEAQFKLAKYQKINEIWGTLGWADNRKLELSGEITISKNGGPSHEGITKEIAELLQVQNVEIDEISQIKERFIDLNSLVFKNAPKEISTIEEIHLRLDIYLEKTEGALVYIQNNPTDNYHPDEAFIQLITPNTTDKNRSQDRHVLSYIFAYTFGKIPEYVNNKLVLKEKMTDLKPVIKVLTFTRTEGDIGAYMKKVSKNSEKLATNLVHKGFHKLGEKKYAIHKFNPSSNTENKGGQFEELTTNSEVQIKIDPTKKTLLLLHGTFSTTSGSYQELTDLRITDGNKKTSLLQHLIKIGAFEQIIAFDHPTASHSPEENVKELLARLSGIIFLKDVSVITTSRGALLAEIIAASPEAHRIMKLDRVLMFAPAHGSDLLNAAKGLDMMLSYFQFTAAIPAWGFILGLAQFSVQAICTQPGLEAMRPGSAELNSILKSEPITEVRFKAMVGDYHRKLFNGFWAKTGTMAADGIIKLIFRDENDWVIGCQEQRMKIHGNKALYEKNFEYFCVHGMQFRETHPKNEKFKDADVFQVIEEYFLN